MNERQRRFLDYYIETGEIAKAARRAGYSEHYATGNAALLLRRPECQAYIGKRNAELSNKRIADMAEINKFWTAVMRDETNDVKDRLKASELRAKVQGAFVDRMMLENAEDKEFKVRIEVVE